MIRCKIIFSLLIIPHIYQVMCAESSFDELLNLVEMNHQLACDPESGGCGKLNHIHHFLPTAPHVFTTGDFWQLRSKHPFSSELIVLTYICISFCVAVVGWQNTCESADDIAATLSALSTKIDISVLYRGLDPKHMHNLVSVVSIYVILYMFFP